MRILAFTDLHTDRKLLAKLIARAKKKDVDVILTAGDYSLFGDGAEQVLSELDKVGKPMVLIPGNHESEGQAKKAQKKYKNIINIHKSHWELENVVFLGYGTGGFAQRDKEFVRCTKKWKKTIKTRRTVLVTHGPPYKTKLDALQGDFVGNKDYTDFVKEFQPALYICGHIHENAGKSDKIGRTIIVNPGWTGKVLEIT